MNEHEKTTISIEKLPDDLDHLAFDRVLINGKIEVYKHRVLYGWRLIAGLRYPNPDNPPAFLDLNYCCGTSDYDYKELRKKVLAIITDNINKGRAYNFLLPIASKIKPYPNDDLFCEYIDKLFELTQSTTNEQQHN